MIFAEPRFIGFFAIVFVVHWLLRRTLHRKTWLLAASYLFYAAWDWRFLSLVLISTAVDFAVGLALDGTDDERRRRAALGISLAANLGLLATFKYFGFFVDSAQDFLEWIGLPVPEWSVHIILPIGISFYTFQTLSYSIDVYRRDLKATRNLLDFALFVAFFPQLLSGPIVRAGEFLPQLEGPGPRMRDLPYRACFLLIWMGYAKKVVLADVLSVPFYTVVADPSQFTAAHSWWVLLGGPFWLYLDFSSYCDIAIGCAGLLGYRLPKNFDFPFLAPSMSQLWTRWHMTLTRWLFDYLFRPLRAKGMSRSWAALWTVLACGLWHGAEWKFIIWGAIIAVIMLGLGVWRHLIRQWAWFRTPRGKKFRTVLGVPLTYVMFAMSGTFFAIPDMERAWDVVTISLGFAPGGSEALNNGWWVFVLGLLLGQPVARWIRHVRPWDRMPAWLYAACLGIAVAAILPWVNTRVQEYVYYQF